MLKPPPSSRPECEREPRTGQRSEGLLEGAKGSKFTVETDFRRRLPEGTKDCLKERRTA